MKFRGVLLAGAMALMAMPANAFYVGFHYKDGSDAIFEMNPNKREVFEVTVSGELEYLGAKGRESKMADFKGLVHPKFPNGTDRQAYICGWVKGFGDLTGRKFVPFMFFRSGDGDVFARVPQSDFQWEMFKDSGCTKALGIEHRHAGDY